MDSSRVWRRISSVLLWLGSVFFALCLFLFICFAPLKTSVIGFSFSLSTLDNPLQIALVLIILGLCSRFLSRTPAAPGPKGTAAIIFCIALFVYISSPVMTSLDSRWTLPTAKSIIQQGNTDLDEFSGSISPGDYRIERIAGHSYSRFPLGPSLLAIPIALITGKAVIDNFYMDVERLAASLLIAVSTIWIYFISLAALGSRKPALMMVFIYCFCSSTWSTATRGLWQHGPSIALLTLALFLLLKAKDRPHLIRYLGLPLFFSFIVRPTNILSLAIFSFFVLVRFRNHFLRFILWTSALAIPFFIYNLTIYDSLLSPYYAPSRLASHPRFIEALAANLISPSRGLFVYSPIFLLGLLGIFLKIKRRSFGLFDLMIGVIVCLHWIAISSFPHWWAGHSYGPRFFSDMIPYLIYFLLPVFAEIQTQTRKNKVYSLIAVLILAGFSFFIHFRGAFSTETFDWNSTPVDVEVNPARIWDWKDIPFLRGM